MPKDRLGQTLVITQRQLDATHITSLESALRYTRGIVRLAQVADKDIDSIGMKQILARIDDALTGEGE